MEDKGAEVIFSFLFVHSDSGFKVEEVALILETEHQVPTVSMEGGDLEELIYISLLLIGEDFVGDVLEQSCGLEVAPGLGAILFYN